MTEQLKQAAQQALEALEAVMRQVRREAPWLTGKLWGFADSSADALRRALTQRPAAQTEREAWVPYLVDRADGVKGHYAIGRWNPRGYREVWNLHSHRWAAYSDDVMSLEEADSLLRQITIPTVRASLPAPQQATPEPERCKSCDDTGHVTDQIGEWRGVCNCPAGDAIGAKATHEPVPAGQAKWCEYVAGMVDCWVSAEWSNYHHKDEDLRVKAIAGIIERRLWALNKQRATPTQQAAGEPNIMEMVNTLIASVNEAHHAKSQEWRDASFESADRVYEKIKEAVAALHTHPAPGVPEGFALVPIKSDDAILRPFYNCPPEELGLAWDAAMRVAQVRLAAAQAKGE